MGRPVNELRPNEKGDSTLGVGRQHDTIFRPFDDLPEFCNLKVRHPFDWIVDPPTYDAAKLKLPLAAEPLKNGSSDKT